MGADFVYAIIPLDRPLEYWQKLIREVSDADLSEFAVASEFDFRFEDLKLSEVREVIDNAFEVAMNGQSREVGMWTPDGGATRYAITGGMSWGDDPTEAYREFETCHSFMDWHNKHNRKG